jgi:hypothetical protein
VVHPDVLDAELGALAHRLLGALGPRSDHDRLDAARDRTQVVVRAVALDLACVGVDREHLVAALAQTLVDGVAAVALGLPRNAGHGDSLVTQELCGGFLDRCHRRLLSQAGWANGS